MHNFIRSLALCLQLFEQRVVIGLLANRNSVYLCSAPAEGFPEDNYSDVLLLCSQQFDDMLTNSPLFPLIQEKKPVVLIACYPCSVRGDRRCALLPAGQVEPVRQGLSIQRDWVGRREIQRLVVVLDPVTLALKRIGGQRDALAAFLLIKALPVDGDAYRPEPAQRREKVR